MLKVFDAERGDTLIEVMFATAVLAFLIVLSVSIMNAGTAQSERAVEGTFVRQAIDSQTELLRFARDAYVNNDPGADTVWNAITAKRVNTGSVQQFSALATSGCKPSGGNSFWLQTNGTTLSVQNGSSVPLTYAEPGQGIWIEAASPSASSDYLDFYLYACWNSTVGTSVATSGTVVRLYVPAS